MMNRCNPYFALPAACERVLVLSNVREGFRLPPLRTGDVIVHLNRAVHFEQVWRLALYQIDVMHVLFARAKSEYRGLFYWPAKLDLFHGVFSLLASQYKGLPFFARYRAMGGENPSAGFIAANLLRTYHPELPIWLVGFAPERGVSFRIPLYQWGVEAAWYAAGHGGFKVLPPEDVTKPTPKPVRLRLLICTCKRFRERRDAQRETWLARLPEWVTYTYFMGGPEAPDADESDVLWLPEVGDGYFDLPAKVLAALRVARRERGWDWLGKLDDDAYLVPERLLPLLQEPAVFVGRAGLGGFARGGPGYYMRREVLDGILAHADEIPAKGAEDRLITSLAIKLGYKLSNSPALLPFQEEGQPGTENDAVCSSNIPPALMREVHERFAT